VFELVVAVEIAGGGAGKLREEGERGRGDAVLKETDVEGRRGRNGDGRF
jgi:hypothetical protein